MVFFMKESPLKKFNMGTVIIIAALGFFFFVAVILLAAVGLSGEGGWTGLGGDRIAVIYIEGTIFDSRTAVEQMKMYGNDERVKAILIRIDSPGGGVAASQEIHDQVLWLREERKKKVIVSMGSVAASGGYYVACAADYIVANPGTVTGSIGVIAEWVNYANLLKWAQVRPEVIKSGEMKDAGSATRELAPKERQYLQGIINQMYQQFVNAVVAGRADKGLTRQRILQLADGRVYTGEEAVREKLIDELGSYEAALRKTAEIAGIRGEPQIVTPPKPRRGSLLDLLRDADVEGIISKGLHQAPGASLQFQYLWK